MWTDNPVLDAENHECKPHTYCGACGGEIYTGDALHYAEDYFEIEGIIFCEECAHEWMKQRRVLCL